MKHTYVIIAVLSLLASCNKGKSPETTDKEPNVLQEAPTKMAKDEKDFWALLAGCRQGGKMNEDDLVEATRRLSAELDKLPEKDLIAIHNTFRKLEVELYTIPYYDFLRLFTQGDQHGSIVNCVFWAGPEVYHTCVRNPDGLAKYVQDGTFAYVSVYSIDYEFLNIMPKLLKTDDFGDVVGKNPYDINHWTDPKFDALMKHREKPTPLQDVGKKYPKVAAEVLRLKRINEPEFELVEGWRPARLARKMTEAEFSAWKKSATLTESDFWKIIKRARTAALAKNAKDPMSEISIEEELKKLSPRDVIEFALITRALLNRLETRRDDVVGVCAILNDVGHGDTLMDFKAWLLYRGLDAYKRVLQAPDTLVDILKPEELTWFPDGAFPDCYTYIDKLHDEKRVITDQQHEWYDKGGKDWQVRLMAFKQSKKVVPWKTREELEKAFPKTSAYVEERDRLEESRKK